MHSRRIIYSIAGIINMNKDIVKDIVNGKIKGSVLLIGMYSSFFKRTYTGTIYSAYTLNSIRELLNRCEFVNENDILMLEKLNVDADDEEEPPPPSDNEEDMRDSDDETGPQIYHNSDDSYGF